METMCVFCETGTKFLSLKLFSGSKNLIRHIHVLLTFAAPFVCCNHSNMRLRRVV